MQTRTETRTETVTDTTLCPPGTKTQYLTVTNKGESTASVYFYKFSNNNWIWTISVSTDNGTTWTVKTATDNPGTKLADLEPGDKLLLKSITGPQDLVYGNTGIRTTDSGCELSGNIASLTHGDNFNPGHTLTMPVGAFQELFKNSNFVSARYVSFDSFDAISDYGCYRMFWYCQNLTAGPDLSRITSVGGVGMRDAFWRCWNLKTLYAPTVTWEQSKFSDWVVGVGPSGTLYADSSIINTIPDNSTYGCPTGWTKQSL